MAEGEDVLEGRLSGLDAPRPLPPELRRRLETAILESAVAEAETGASGRPIPPHLRRRLEAALVSRRRSGTGGRPRRRRAGLGAAAAVVVALTSAALLSATLLSAGGGGSAELVAVPGGPAPGSTTPATSPDREDGPAETSPVPAGPGGEVDSGPREIRSPIARPRAPAVGGSGAAAGRVEPVPAERTTPPTGPAGEETASAPSDPGPPPPFASADHSGESATLASPAPGPSSPPSASDSSPPPAAPGPRAGGESIRIGMVRGDAHQEAGLQAYVDLLNASGGIRGRPIELVVTSADKPAVSTLATVNASDLAVAAGGGAPEWVTGPLLETLAITEDLLARGDADSGRAVFSFASPLERQARLVAKAVFPDASPGSTAVVYREAGGPFASQVPSAIEAVLSALGVDVAVVTYDPANPLPLRDTDAAFLSLGPDSASAWLDQARRLGHSPARGVAGIASLFDPGLLRTLPDGARVLSPYVLPPGQEGSAIASGAGTTSARALHGWTTAKALAIALWRSGADTPVELAAALEALAGHDLGTAPPYETRGGTRSRTPEGVLFEVRSGAFAAQGGYRRDSL